MQAFLNIIWEKEGARHKNVRTKPIPIVLYNYYKLKKEGPLTSLVIVVQGAPGSSHQIATVTVLKPLLHFPSP